MTTWNVRSNVDPSGWSNRNPAGQSVILGGSTVVSVFWHTITLYSGFLDTTIMERLSEGLTSG